MTRNLKAFGLTLVAVFAMSAVAASAAQAEETEQQGLFTAAEYPATLTGTEPVQNEFHIPKLGSLTCPGSTFSGTLAAASSTAKITPSYPTECHTKVGVLKFPTHVTLNGCYYTFHVGITKPGGTKDQYTGSVDLKCPEEKDVIIHVYENKTKTEKNESTCTYTIKPKDNLTSVTYETTTAASPEDIDVTGTVKVPYSESTGHTVCGPTEGEAEYTVNVTLKADNKFGEPIKGTLTMP